MTTFVHSGPQSDQRMPTADRSSCGGRFVVDDAAALQAREASRRVVRRRILEAQLSRLLRRIDGGPSASDAADRAARLIARLERDDLDW
jgi:hypothetical protein